MIRVPLDSDKARWSVIDSEIAAAIAARDQRKVVAKNLFESWLTSTNADSLRSQVPVNGRLVSLPLNEGAGNEIKTVSEVSDITATASGDLNWSVKGKLGRAIHFKPGSTVDVGALGDFARNQPFSHAEWMRAETLSQFSSLVARMDEMNMHRGWDLFFHDGHLAVHIVQSWPDNAIKVTTQAPVIKPDTWHHVCMTWDGSGKPEGISIFVDGAKQPTVTNNSNLKPDADIRTETSLRLGQRSHAAAFYGSIQDFHLYERLLTKAEVDALRQSELLARALETPADKRSDAQLSELFEHYLARHDAEFSKLAASVNALQSEHAAIETRSPMTHVQVERTDQPAMANILMRGQYDNVGEEVAAAPPAALHPLSADAPKNRLGLARWVVDPANPLTARVTVNRFWQELFRSGNRRDSRRLWHHGRSAFASRIA